VKHFEGRPITFRVEGEKLCLSGEDIGKHLGYKNPAEAVSRLFRLHADEFDNDCAQMSVMNIPGGPPRRERVFTLDGLILLCMFSEQPVAKKFRRWLRKIAKEVMTTGQYANPQLLSMIEESRKFQAHFLESHVTLSKLVDSMKHSQELLRQEIETLKGRPFLLSSSIELDTREWYTAGQYVRQVLRPQNLPKRFNSGGSFDVYAAEEHNKIVGGYPRQRSRRHIGKLMEFVFPPGAETSIFVRTTYEKYRQLQAERQRKLPLRIATK